MRKDTAAGEGKELVIGQSKYLRQAQGMVACLLLLVSVTAARPPQKQKLVVAIQPTFAVAEMLERAKPLEQFLEQKLGDVDVEVYVPLSQAGVIEALRFGHAHAAFMGPWAAQLAVEMAGAELVLAEVREVLIDGKPAQATYYYSYWIVLPSSPYHTLAELRGKRACFPSPVSGSGYVGPLGRLVETKLLNHTEGQEANPQQFFGQVLFAGGYGQCWQALQAGQVDVTVIAGDVPARLYHTVLENSRVLDQQGPLPSHAVLVSRELREPLRSRVVEAIAALGAPEHRPLMRTFISGIFVGFERSSAEKHLAAFRRYLDLTGLQFTERIGR
ncbi:MAG: phosphate/phosphite/phosphonate ABC transporter substrate-binding protein [Acidobacteriia bacterium]|nr:phosphate/phosphite/phosphonate ABC transporter substrate-binding protein [Terriglobia bacterium]